MMTNFNQPPPPGPLQKIITFLAVLGIFTVFVLGILFAVAVMEVLAM